MSLTSWGAGVSCGLIHVEDALGCHLRTRGVGAICRGKIELLQFVCGFVCVAMPDSVNGELDQPCNLLYRLKNVCPCRTR